ncbi:hypothetical protein EVAR_43912_1 [Eumeta japonica]|uniref:Uncharacterized protein n=1 Tax=Eumeta variegata TaxID=151549 RepID=A0A4C1WN67_EUMVA|nr:hypothetical protein EVAR_43912_1 [Eumeta japonica]
MSSLEKCVLKNILLSFALWRFPIEITLFSYHWIQCQGTVEINLTSPTADVRESSGGQLFTALSINLTSAVKYPFPTQDVSNATVTCLDLRAAMNSVSKLACKPSEDEWSPSILNTRNVIGVTGALVVWNEISDRGEWATGTLAHGTKGNNANLYLTSVYCDSVASLR